MKSDTACATAGGDGACRCSWGKGPGKFSDTYRKGGDICFPNPTFGSATDTCTPPGYGSSPSEYDVATAAGDANPAADGNPLPRCATYTSKITCPQAAGQCVWGGWFCQPPPTGRVPDGSNYGACEIARSAADCAATGGDGACRCTWGKDPGGAGTLHKRPGGQICYPRVGFQAGAVL